MIGMSELKREIKRQKRLIDIKRQNGFNFLGFVEREELSKEAESCFSFVNRIGVVAGYDWINGNDKLRQIIKETI